MAAPTNTIDPTELADLVERIGGTTEAAEEVKVDARTMRRWLSDKDPSRCPYAVGELLRMKLHARMLEGAEDGD